MRVGSSPTWGTNASMVKLVAHGSLRNYCRKAWGFKSLYSYKYFNMKIFKLGKQIEHDCENQRYTFRIYLFGFIPMEMICDWKDNITNKKKW